MKNGARRLLRAVALCLLALSFALHAAPTGPSIVRTEGRAIRVKKRLINDSLSTEYTYTIRGICFQPLEIGDTQTATASRLYANKDKDLPKVKDMNANTLRLYGYPSMNAQGMAFLDACYDRGIMVIPTVLIYYLDNHHVSVVNYFKNHPAILAWSFGNEFEYNNLYGNSATTLDACITKISNAVREVKAIDANHPTIIAWGDINGLTTAYYNRMSHADIFSFNMYRGTNFGTAFTVWQAKSGKPMFIGEYGADAYDARVTLEYPTGRENEEAQAFATRALTKDIISNLVSLNASKVCSGGTIFEYSDEWWKYQGAGNKLNVQESYTSDMPGGGVYPDGKFNEEWWGVVKINRIPRQAYYVLQELYAGVKAIEPVYPENELLMLQAPRYVKGGSHTARLLSTSTIVSPSLFLTNEDGASNSIAITRQADGEWRGTLVIPNTMKNGVWYLGGAATVDATNYSALEELIVDMVPPTVPANFTVKKASSTSVTASWSAATDVASGVQKYVLTGDALSAPYETTNLSYTHSIRSTTAKKINYKIYAVDYVGNIGEEATTQYVRESTNAKGEYPHYSSRVIAEGQKFSIIGYLYPDELYTMQVFDARGNRIMRDSLRALKEGRYALEWDGFDARGNKVPRGLYYVKVKMGTDKTRTGKVFVQ